MERKIDYWTDPGDAPDVDVVGNALAEDDLGAGGDRGARGRRRRVHRGRGRRVRWRRAQHPLVAITSNEGAGVGIGKKNIRLREKLNGQNRRVPT